MMSYRIRRKSMERLQLYDMDQLTTKDSSPPPLPPRLHQKCRLPPDLAFEKYHFLCDMIRHQHDPVYASTPMFSVIPQKSIRYRRQILGSRVPSNIITPVSSKTPKSDEETDDEKEKNEKNEESSEDDDDDEEDEEDDDDDDDASDESSSSSSESSNDDLGGDDNEKGIVETILNRDKR